MAIVGFRWFARKKSFGHREPLELVDIYRDIEDQVDFETFMAVYKALGEAYRIDARLIRPTDALKHFFDVDSWDLDSGTDQMNQWLARYDVRKQEHAPVTVLDLLVLASAAPRARE
jgi:hypothetical protein